MRRLEPHEVGRVDRELPLSRLRSPDDDASTYLIAWAGDRPIGHAHIAWRETHLGVPEIQDVFVLPAERRRGVATELTHAAEDEARARGLASISLGVSLSGNPSARRLYEELGFLDAGREPVRVSGEIMLRGSPLQVDDTLLYMIKAL